MSFGRFEKWSGRNICKDLRFRVSVSIPFLANSIL